MGVRIPPGLEQDLIPRVRSFLLDIYLEMKKVSWPSRKEMVGSTAVVIIFSIVVAIIIGILDYCYSLGLVLFFGR